MATREEILKARTAELLELRKDRNAFTLSRFGMKRLDNFTEDQLDPDYVYCFQNDEKANIAMAEQTGYEMVSTSDIPGYKSYNDTAESSAFVRRHAGTDEENKKMYAYLMRIPRDIWEYDQAQEVKARKDQMNGIVTDINGATLPNVDSSKGDSKGVFTMPESSLGKSEPLAKQTVTRKRSL